MAEAKKKKVDVYTLLTAEAEAVAAGSSGLFFLPYLSGERTPHADPDARGCFIGLTLSHQRGHLIRSILEGVTYSMRESLAIFEGLGVPIKQIRASGGGARSALWRQIQADAFGRKVVTINSEEGAGLRRGALGGRRGRRVQEHRRGLRGDDPRRQRDRAQPGREEGLRRRLSRLSAALPLAEGRFQGDCAVGVMRLLELTLLRH